MTESDGATELDADERAGLRFKHVTTRGQLDQLEQANIQALRKADQRDYSALFEFAGLEGEK